ncbi:pyridoxamine 5'-phosphate oxidase family protein [Nitriliruptor alkaliphilus]|uniref:pyridoxamine 5'-phosphate oxidase family protein n=1 Tax=Nitriliruptor alkaliphilus TaxID=427918 RepID=UPI00069669E7|nr:pyridoxamine 5'-phosphate oxidase family protein [Nitriliruptor alkaliphilus]
MRHLSDLEMASVLAAKVPGVLATIDDEGFPYLTPIWFVHHEGHGVIMTSTTGRPHIRHIRRDPGAGFVVDLEGNPDSGGRPNVQVKARGHAILEPDHAAWTRRITRKYGGSERLAAERADTPRLAIILQPERLIGVAAGPRSNGAWWTSHPAISPVR